MEHKPFVRMVPGATTAVLLIHGICGTPRHFDWLLPAIPGSWSVHALVLDGHGGSVRDFSRTSMGKWQRQVELRLRELCDTHQRVYLVGHSLGTLLAMGAAEGNPQVAGLLLLNPPLSVRVRPRMLGMHLRLVFGRSRTEDPAELALSQDVGIVLSRNLFLYLGWIPRFWELLRLCGKSRPVASRIERPCRVFLGRQDELVSLRSRRFFPESPSVVVGILEKSGHFHTSPEEQTIVLQAWRELISVGDP